MESDRYSNLASIDLLEVGPVRVEKKKLIMPYCVHMGKRTESIDLIYTYEDDVFDPEDRSDINLAAMIGSQVALNYGLFCRRIAFHGPYDDSDRRFIRDMMENTCREILVKKLWEPNPFLTDAIQIPDPKKRQRYTNAELEFSQQSSDTDMNKSSWNLWTTRRDGHMILSSGGKDSLLTFGLLREMGREVHPVFINESGRHWFTALNAYRHFRENIPTTARVWENADRVFAWFLRHLPFIRKDFATVRSDEYPIRLWTVAVFIFGSLPLAKKRGIGRILVGDEFDTSVKSSYRGVTHYNGLYDQSRYFDNAMSRYYMRKGWNVYQFSILRQMSELLIEKVLAQRYPDLLANQMSCHATHIKAERVLPCGQCEKCRRIVSMLEVVGADPSTCGYRKEQVERCLNDIVTMGIHQERGGVQEILYQLWKKKLINLPAERERDLQEQPEIMKLRVDPERSPIEGIPADLRTPLVTLLLKYSNGAARRKGRIWKNIDILRDPDMIKPYPFELTSSSQKRSTLTKESGRRIECKWGEMKWPEAEERFKVVDTALLPVGSIEQHGPHLPLDTDAYDAEYLSQKVAEACSDPKPLVLPLISYGVSYEHSDFSGTISIGNETLSRLVYEIGISIANNGINKLVIINGHGGNGPALNFAAQIINRDAHIFVCVDSGETSDVDVYGLVGTQNDIHAGEAETSTSLAVRPHLVRMDLARPSVPRFSSRYLNFTNRRYVNWYAHTKRLSKNGVIGDPTKASAEKGRRIWQAQIAHLVSLVEDIKGMTLDDIHHRNY